MTSTAPLKVSPVIKFSRWALLSVGIVYGMRRNASLSVVENNRRAKRDAILREEEPILRREKEMRDEEELRTLQRNFFPDDLTPGQVEKQK